MSRSDIWDVTQNALESDDVIVNTPLQPYMTDLPVNSLKSVKGPGFSGAVRPQPGLLFRGSDADAYEPAPKKVNPLDVEASKPKPRKIIRPNFLRRTGAFFRLLFSVGFKAFGDKTPLLARAVENYDLKLLKILLDLGVDPDTEIDVGVHPLHVLAGVEEQSKFPGMNLLLNYGADLNLQDDGFERTPLMEALVENNTPGFHFLLAQHPDLSLQDSGGRTVGHIAVEVNEFEALVSLIDAGLDLLIENHVHNTVEDCLVAHTMASEEIGIIVADATERQADDAGMHDYESPFKKREVAEET